MCLPHRERLATTIAFLDGAENGLFLPNGAEMTYDLLREKNGDGLYTHHAVQPPRTRVLGQILRPGPSTVSRPSTAPPGASLVSETG